MNRWALLALEKLRTLPMLRDVNMDQQNKGLETRLVIDRDTAARLGARSSRSSSEATMSGVPVELCTFSVDVLPLPLSELTASVA